MSLILPSDSLEAIERANRRRDQLTKTRFRGILGNDAGVIYVQGFNGNRVYVRLSSSADDNGRLVYSQPAIARLDGGLFQDVAGYPVVCEYDETGQLLLRGADSNRVEQSGVFSMAVLNPTHEGNQWVNMQNVLIGLSRPVSTADTTSTKVAVSPILYDHYGTYHEFEGTPFAADKIQLSSYIPSAGNWRVCQLWLDTFNNTVVVTASTTQAMTSAIDGTDYDECFAQRWNDYTPLGSYLLQNNQSVVTATSIYRDHRQWLNMPNEVGFPSTLPHHYRVRSNRSAVMSGSLNVGSYTLAIDGTLAIL